jgi:hypothetical protein
MEAPHNATGRPVRSIGARGELETETIGKSDLAEGSEPRRSENSHMTAFVIAGLLAMGVIGYMAWLAEHDVIHAIIVTCAAAVLLAILALVIVISFGIGTTTT